jgi:hypothetical protein
LTNGKRLVTKRKLDKVISDLRISTKAGDKYKVRLFKAKRKILKYNYKKVRQVIMKIRGKLAKIKAKSNKWLKKILRFTNPEFEIEFLTRVSEKLKNKVDSLTKRAYVSKMRMAQAKNDNDTRKVSKLSAKYKRLMKNAASNAKLSKGAEIEASIARKTWRKAAETSYKSAKENFSVINVKLKKISSERKVKNKNQLIAKIRESLKLAEGNLAKAKNEIKKREDSLGAIVETVRNDIH